MQINIMIRYARRNMPVFYFFSYILYAFIFIKKIYFLSVYKWMIFHTTSQKHITVCRTMVYKWNQRFNDGRTDILSSCNTPPLARTPLSPDLAPMNFALFPSLNSKLRVQSFSEPNNLQYATKYIIPKLHK